VTAEKMVLHCNRGDYTTGVIDDPHGIPNQLVQQAIKWHEAGNRGHKVAIVPAKGHFNVYKADPKL